MFCYCTCRGISLSLVLYTSDKGQLAEGIVLQIPLGNLSRGEAQSKLDQMQKEIYKRPVFLIAGDKSYSLNLEELGFSYSFEEPLQKAYLIGREGNIFNKAFSKFNARWGITFTPNYHWDDHVLREVLIRHLSELNISSENARFLVNSDHSLRIVPEKPGKQIDFESLMTSIKKEPYNDISKISIPFEQVNPTITKADLAKVKMYGLLSKYSTSFDPNQKERTINLQLAAKSVDGLVLQPGEVFSFNRTVGPRTAEAGYQEALIIEGNSFVPGLGGGVCQVSSTLFNAVHSASPLLTVVERSRHSLPVAYVPPGQDATVAYPDLDFKFRNDSKTFLLIRSDVNNNTLTFQIFGEAK